MFPTIRGRNVHGGFSGKIPDHSIITKTCQKRPFFDFDQNLTENSWRNFSGKFFLWNYRFLGVSPRKPHVREESGSFFKKFSVRRVYAFWPFWMIHMVFSLFLEFRTSERLDITYFDRSKWCARFGHCITHVLHNWLCIISIIYAKMGVFSHFLEIGTSDWLDVAYFECAKWLAWFGHSITHVPPN